MKKQHDIIGNLRYLPLLFQNVHFPGSREAGQKSAVLFTIVENCRRQRIELFAYMREVFDNVGNITNKNVGDWDPEG